jgi:cytochrome c oxidase cbb3-type subunit 3
MSDVTTADRVGVPEHVEEAPLMEHAYDGIREYDNPLPGWWRAMFWATIVFAAGYWIWFHVAGFGRSPEEKYQAALAEYQGKRDLREAAEAASVNEDSLVRNVQDPKLTSHGAEVFAVRCASCHDATGHGLIGPNLTDDYQLHGSSRMDIFRTVRGGVPGTAMPAWGEQMSPSDVVAVASFAISLRGQNLPGKEPQGQKVERFK